MFVFWHNLHLCSSFGLERFENTVICQSDRVGGCVCLRGQGDRGWTGGWEDEVSGVAGVHIELMDLKKGVDGGTYCTGSVCECVCACVSMRMG